MLLSTDFIGFRSKLLFFLDGLCGSINLSGLNYVLGLPFSTIDLPLQVALEGFGLCLGNHLVNDGSQTYSQNKGDNWNKHIRKANSYHYGIHNSYLSLSVFKDFKNINQRANCGIFGEESLKETAVNYEIFFARA